MTSQTRTPRPLRLSHIPVSWLIGLLLVLGVIVVYWPVFGYGFVAYDDPKYVWHNPQVQAGLSWQGIVWAFKAFYDGNWHPLTWLSYMLDTRLFGFHAGVYHAVNVFFHTANTVLLFLLLKRMTSFRQNRLQPAHDLTLSNAPKTARPAERTATPQAGTLWRSAFVAALFGFHPLHVESVAWISERKDVLSTFFFMLTLLAYTQYAQASQLRRSRSRVLYGLALLWFALGLMSKPMLVTLPFVLLLLDYWPLKRVTSDEWQMTGTKATDSRFLPSLITRLSPLFLEKLPFFVLTAASCVVTFLAQEHGKAVVSINTMPMGMRIENALIAYAAYIGKMLWPDKLAACYPLVPVNLNLAMAPLLILVLISAGVFVWGRRRPYLLTGWLWYLGTLIPVIGLVQVGSQSMADRYTYIPLIGLFIAITWGAADILSGWRYRRVIMTVVPAVVLGACLTLTARQVRYWQDSVTLGRHALAVTVNNAPMEVVLGNGLVEQGRIKEAAQHFAEALRISPDSAPAFEDMALALAAQGKLQHAIDLCRAALKRHPRDVKLHHILASTLLAEDKFSEAIASYQITLQVDPADSLAMNNLAWILATAPEARLRNGVTAVKLATKACRLTNYKTASLVGTLAAAYAEAGRFDDAIKTAEQAVALATAHGEKVLAAKNLQLLQLYQAHKAYHEPAKR